MSKAEPRFSEDKTVSHCYPHFQESGNLPPPHREAVVALWSLNARHKLLEIKGQVAQWVEAGALEWPWPGPRLLVWGSPGPPVVGLPVWAVHVKEVFFLEISAGTGDSRWSWGCDQGSGHLFWTCFHSHVSCFNLA